MSLFKARCYMCENSAFVFSALYAENICILMEGKGQKISRKVLMRKSRTCMKEFKINKTLCESLHTLKLNINKMETLHSKGLYDPQL